MNMTNLPWNNFIYDDHRISNCMFADVQEYLSVTLFVYSGGSPTNGVTCQWLMDGQSLAKSIYVNTNIPIWYSTHLSARYSVARVCLRRVSVTLNATLEGSDSLIFHYWLYHLIFCCSFCTRSSTRCDFFFFFFSLGLLCAVIKSPHATGY